jgi:hypothetical protein
MHPHTLNFLMYGFLDVSELPEGTGDTAETAKCGKRKNIKSFHRSTDYSGGII